MLKNREGDWAKTLNTQDLRQILKTSNETIFKGSRRTMLIELQLREFVICGRLV
jgi:hypothetical protein